MFGISKNKVDKLGLSLTKPQTIQCDHLHPCQKFLVITCDRIDYKGWKICHIFTETITF